MKHKTLGGIALYAKIRVKNVYILSKYSSKLKVYLSIIEHIDAHKS